jgi:hypothetical protein
MASRAGLAHRGQPRVAAGALECAGSIVPCQEAAAILARHPRRSCLVPESAVMTSHVWECASQ